MAAVAVIGEPALVQGYTLAGAVVFAAADVEAVRDAWRALEPDTTLVILTPAAAAALAARLPADEPLTVVMPE
ncbi:hypothetical protein [Nocardia australiensis]|uniref:hypothetical protein n=1 Tax=Nocardia australiensis TaxID=2887191 RepID=UPI001D142F2D|nr:hypothetical protein [Nocardia australiensis]